MQRANYTEEACKSSSWAVRLSGSCRCKRIFYEVEDEETLHGNSSDGNKSWLLKQQSANIWIQITKKRMEFWIHPLCLNMRTWYSGSYWDVLMQLNSWLASVWSLMVSLGRCRRSTGLRSGQRCLVYSCFFNSWKSGGYMQPASHLYSDRIFRKFVFRKIHPDAGSVQVVVFSSIMGIISYNWKRTTVVWRLWLHLLSLWWCKSSVHRNDVAHLRWICMGCK